MLERSRTVPPIVFEYPIDWGQGRLMGGTFGEVRDKSKIEVYLKYKEIAEDDMFPTRIPDLKNKKHCQKEIVWEVRSDQASALGLTDRIVESQASI
jgi:hypothetical protein